MHNMEEYSKDRSNEMTEKFTNKCDKFIKFRYFKGIGNGIEIANRFGNLCVGLDRRAWQPGNRAGGETPSCRADYLRCVVYT